MANEVCMENLDEYINDESKIVTYKWLSRTLEVHVNEAKQNLYTFVTKQRKEKNVDLNVIYLVSGVTKEKVHQVMVVREEDLDKTKAQLEPVTSCHVYSVQKAKLKDSNALYMADYDLMKQHIMKSNKYSAITYTLAKLRSKEALEQLAALNINKPEPKSEAQNASSKTSKTSPPSKKSAAGKKGISGMFANAEKKKQEKEVKKEVEPQKKAPETKSNKGSGSSKSKGGKQAGMTSFFSKQAKKIEDSPPSRKKVKRDDDSDDEKTVSKRRRVIESSSESEEEEMEPEEPLPPTPPREKTPPPAEEKAESPIPSPQKDTTNKPEDSNNKTNGQRRRKRRRKQVNKTTMDEEGFMVTEKVWESESTDASDVEVVPAKSPRKQNTKETKSAAVKKAASKTGNKQTSLMSFFKKK